MNNSSITYELLRFKNSSDEQFLDAMEVYRKTTSHDQKTDIKEITYWVDNLKQFEIGELFFFGLKANGLVIGYAELAYIKQERILIIDYINIASEYRTNSSFYSFYSLIMNYMDQNNCDYDYITIEILSKYGNKPIRNEEVCQYELENFKMVNTLYIQPLLETHNDESSTEALIMIYTRAGESYQLKKETFLHIVDTIYNYYLYWDSKVCDIKELTKRGALKDVNTNLKNEEYLQKKVEEQEKMLNEYEHKNSEIKKNLEDLNKENKEIKGQLLVLQSQKKNITKVQQLK